MLAPGTAIGHYEILSALGAGGMGEVYRARDGKLHRDVAIKVLPQVFTVDPDRLARFRREAQVLAALNHPNIGHIYGLEDTGPTHALVLELVEGPTLADRIEQGAIPLDEALPFARQIADALESAHEQGIIHRDLKPANIKIRPDGTVKVLDFGLAKALEAPSDGGVVRESVMNSPTLTARGTQQGIIIGTAAYMAPEQARGRAVDRRADIWAFGVILYEMVTGRRAFEGDDISITLASVLKEDPKWDLLPPDLPPSLRRLLRRCFEKDPKRRLTSIADARLELDESGESATTLSTSQPVPTAPGRLRYWAPWAFAAAASLTAIVLWAPWKQPPSAPPVRIAADLGFEGPLSLTIGPAAVISPDGRTAVFVVQRSGRPALFVRRLDQLGPTLLNGTEDAHAPFFSPDNRWIAFFAQGKLKKISVSGGATVTLCDAISGRGGWWGEDGYIIFQPAAAAGAVLQRVSAAGGTATPLTKEVMVGGASQRWPQMLPGGRALMFSVNTGANWDEANIVVQPLPHGEQKVLVTGGFHGRYADGQLLFVRQGTLYAVPLDPARLEVHGTPSPVIEGVASTIATGGAQFSIADNGTLVYVPGATPTLEMPVSWVDETGKSSVLRNDAADWWTPSFSPDGKRLAMTIGGAAAADIWIYEWARNALTKFTFGAGADSSPVWTPDGSRIAYTSASAGTAEVSAIGNLFWKRSDGSGEAQRLTNSPNPQTTHSFHPSGKYLAFSERRLHSGLDLMILPLDGDEKSGWKPGAPTAFLSTPAAETQAAFSPDGKWLAYMSTESNIPEIYVRPFGGGEGQWKVSEGPALYPAWSRARRELLYFTSGQNLIMTVAYEAEGSSFRHERPRQWTPSAAMPMRNSRPFDIYPDGKRLAIRKSPDVPQQQASPVFVFNFTEDLRRQGGSK